jgi:hypothetical protein
MSDRVGGGGAAGRLRTTGTDPRSTTTLGNYRQHITFASVLGLGYAWVAYTLAGVHWLYGSVAALLATLGGLLPDLDSASGVELKGFTGILGVLASLAVWNRLGAVDPEPAFEYHLWAVFAAYLLVRHGLRRVLTRFTVHRGISHSLPCCAVWGALTFLYYPGHHFVIHVMMAVAVMIGFFSHLLLDEICSVDLKGARVNKAFGTAIKFWAPSAWTTLMMYALLSYLTWRIIAIWPPGPLQLNPPASPVLPFKIPDHIDLRSLETTIRR